MSRDLADADYYISEGGTIPIRWTAPEAVYYRKYSTASDVWSYGCVLYEMWSLGHKPFENCSNTQVSSKVQSSIGCLYYMFRKNTGSEGSQYRIQATSTTRLSTESLQHHDKMLVG